jgi:tryptophan-rich sensory protein/dienelactone hydrolase
MGASMGGLMAVRAAQRDPAGLSGVVLISPALDISASAPPVVRALGAVIGRVAPAAPVATLELGALSRDPAVAAAYAADPLTHHGKVPARTGAEMLAAGAAAMASAHRWRLPAYIIAGDADRIVPVTGTQRFAAAARGAGADVTLRIVPGGYHEPLSEPGGDGLVDAAAEWILARANRPLAAGVAEPASRSDERRVYTWRAGLAFGAAVNIAARLAGTNTGRYGELARPWFAPPGWVFPVAWGINSALSIWGNLRVLNGPPSGDRSAYLRLWAGTWLLYTLFGYAFFRRRSPLLGLLVTVNFLVLSVLSASRAVRIDRDLWKAYATLLPWLVLATAVAGSVALENPDPLLDPPEGAGR